MIWAALTVAGKWLKMVPREVWYALAAAALLWWIDHRAYDRGYQARTAEYEAEARKAVERARVADQAAGDTVDETRTEVEQGNEDARNAARDSDDPLRAGLDRLRQ